tara:strand:- start:723 stop:1127 length:405 start_codon:yes stop_codon:yes gene_type:complete
MYAKSSVREEIIRWVKGYSNKNTGVSVGRKKGTSTSPNAKAILEKEQLRIRDIVNTVVEVDMPIQGLPDGLHTYALFIKPGYATISSSSSIEMAKWLSRQRDDINIYRWHIHSKDVNNHRKTPKKKVDFLEKIK